MRVGKIVEKYNPESDQNEQVIVKKWYQVLFEFLGTGAFAALLTFLLVNLPVSCEDRHRTNRLENFTYLSFALSHPDSLSRANSMEMLVKSGLLNEKEFSRKDLADLIDTGKVPDWSELPESKKQELVKIIISLMAKEEAKEEKDDSAEKEVSSNKVAVTDTTTAKSSNK